MRRCGYNDFLKISCSCWLQDNQQYREKKITKSCNLSSWKKKKTWYSSKPVAQTAGLDERMYQKNNTLQDSGVLYKKLRENKKKEGSKRGFIYCSLKMSSKCNSRCATWKFITPKTWVQLKLSHGKQLGMLERAKTGTTRPKEKCTSLRLLS